jgi:hypothetical protein
VMDILSQEQARWSALFAQTGRNDLCPCGSGRKFKLCHGNWSPDEDLGIPIKPAPIAQDK